MTWCSSHRNSFGIDWRHYSSVPLSYARSLWLLDPNFISHLHEDGPSLFYRASWWFTWMLPFIFEHCSMLSWSGWHVQKTASSGETCPLPTMALIVWWCLSMIPFPLCLYVAQKKVEQFPSMPSNKTLSCCPSIIRPQGSTLQIPNLKYVPSCLQYLPSIPSK